MIVPALGATVQALPVVQALATNTPAVSKSLPALDQTTVLAHLTPALESVTRNPTLVAQNMALAPLAVLATETRAQAPALMIVPMEATRN